MWLAVLSALHILTFLATSVAALCTSKHALGYSPNITSPGPGWDWEAGTLHSVTWDNSLPPGIRPSQVSQTVDIALGYIENNSENLNWTMAKDVPLYSNVAHKVQLPSGLAYKKTYVIALVRSQRKPRRRRRRRKKGGSDPLRLELIE